MTNKLILFTRFPEPGKTKTRLIPQLGEKGAADLQKEMTEHIVRQARKTNASIECRYAGGSPEQMRTWLGEDLHYVEQGGGDLGEKMARSMSDHFASGAKRVIVIGADCPANDWENIEQAFDALDQHECVIGPATDGGYYLIGLSKEFPPLFQRIDWGGEQVFQQTLNAATELSVVQLQPLNDVDLAEDIPPKISVIIPTLNEEELLGHTLERVQEGFNVEVIVVDGCSTDGTRAVFPDAMECRAGRAAQQNMGASKAIGELLLFLHADTELPNGWDWEIRKILSDESITLGAFTFKVRESFRGREFIERATNWRSKKRNLPYGDQGLFIRNELFEKVGRFPDLPIMEDYAFVHTMQKHGEIKISRKPALTSGRRWKRHGILKVTLVNQLLIAGYRFGVSPEKLARMYRK